MYEMRIWLQFTSEICARHFALLLAQRIVINRYSCNRAVHVYSYSSSLSSSLSVSFTHKNTNTHHMSNARQLKFFNCQLKAKLIKLSKRAETCN